MEQLALSCEHWFVTSEFPFLSEIGLGLTGFGIFFSFLGIIFFFDKGLIAMGNVSLLSWVIIIKILERLGLTGRSYYQPVLIMPFQILFLSGLGLTIGLKSTMQFFTKPKNYKVWQTPILLELLPIDMTNIPLTVPWTGYNLIRRWIFPGSHWVAFFWHALGGIWLYCTLQVE